MNNGMIQTALTDIGSVMLVILAASTALLLIAFATSAMLKRASSAQRFTVWQFSFVGLLLVPFAAMLTPAIPLGWFQPTQLTFIDSQNERAESSLPMVESVARPTEYLQPTIPFLQPKPFDNGVHVDLDGVSQRPHKSTVQRSENATLPVPQSPKTPRWVSPMVAVFLLWTLGCVGLLLRISTAMFGARSIARRSIPVAVGQLKHHEAMPTGVAIRLSHELSIPVITGMFKPSIILPSNATRWDADRLNCVLKHEIAHIVRRDLIWQTVAAVAKAIFWLHPLAWLAERAMWIEREQACDDAVLRSGVRSSDYANVLLAFAHEFSGKQIVGLGALSMAQKPIEKRLSNILSATIVRNDSSRRFTGVTSAVFILFAIVACMLRPMSPIPAAASEIQRKNNAVEIASLLADPMSTNGLQQSSWPGKVLLPDGSPIVGAKIECTIGYQTRSNKRGTLLVQHSLPMEVTNSNGEFELRLENIDFDSPIYSIRGFVTCDGYPDFELDYFVNRQLGEKPMRDIVMERGRKISGRIVAPKDSKNAAVDVFVRLVGDGPPSPYHELWHSSTIRCDDSGSFEAYVPNVGRVELTATASNFAAIQIPIAPQYSDQGDIELKTGKSVFGTVLDRTGKPVPGVVVRIESKKLPNPANDSEKRMFELFRPIAVSDAQGNYRLPPFNGDCRILLARYEKLLNEDSFVHSPPQMPIVLPRLINLDENEISLRQDFREGKTSVISGTVQWEDGSPGVDVPIYASLRLNNSPSVRVDATHTSANGEYELRIPSETKNATSRIVVQGMRSRENPKSGRVAARHNITKAETQNRTSTLNLPEVLDLNNSDSDLDGVDWILSEQDAYRPATPTPTQTDRAKNAQRILQDIAKRFRREQKTHALKRRLAKTAPERLELKSEDWSGRFKNELIKLESEYRGENAALMAWLQTYKFYSHENDQSYANASNREERVRLFEILTDHYIDHHDLDLAFFQIFVMRLGKTGIDALEYISDNSPHRHVRAAAAARLCIVMNDLISYRNLMEQNNWKITFDIVDDTHRTTHTFDLNSDLASSNIQRDRDYAPTGKSLRDLLSEFDPIKMRDRFWELANVIERDYSDVPTVGFLPHYIGHDADFFYARSKNRMGQKSSTFWDRMQPLLFAAKFVQRGKIAPEINGTDGLGNPFSLRSLNGKVVLLYIGSSKSNLEKYRAMKIKFKNQPFEIVGILSDYKIDTIKQAIDDEIITWQTVWDGFKAPISARWDPTGECNVFLIAPDGTIEWQSLDNEPLDDVIQRMIKTFK